VVRDANASGGGPRNDGANATPSVSEQSLMTGKGTAVNFAFAGLTGNGYPSVCSSARE